LGGEKFILSAVEGSLSARTFKIEKLLMSEELLLLQEFLNYLRDEKFILSAVEGSLSARTKKASTFVEAFLFLNNLLLLFFH
jgi:hypothetical protein